MLVIKKLCPYENNYTLRKILSSHLLRGKKNKTKYVMDYALLERKKIA